MSPAETKSEKALRILGERRLTIRSVGHGGWIYATCRGETEAEIYDLGYDPKKDEWRCTCEANAKFHKVCSHLEALKLVVVKG